MFISFIIVINGCSSLKKDREKTDRELSEVVLNDFNMSVAPNTLDRVGFIFAIDQNKKQIPITYLDIKATEGEAKLRSASENRKMSWGVLGNFLGLSTLGLLANTGIDNNAKVETAISFDGTVISRAMLLDIDQILSQKKQEIKNFVINNHYENFKFYLIIETIKAKKVNYKFSSNVAGNQSLDANFKNIAKLNQNIKWDNSHSFQLEYDLSSPLNLFYKTYDLNIQSSLVGGIDIILDKKSEQGQDGMIYTSK